MRITVLIFIILIRSYLEFHKGGISGVVTNGVIPCLTLFYRHGQGRWLKCPLNTPLISKIYTNIWMYCLYAIMHGCIQSSTGMELPHKLRYPPVTPKLQQFHTPIFCECIISYTTFLSSPAYFAPTHASI